MARADELGTLTPHFFGFDHRIYVSISLSRALWLSGFADRACRIAKSAIDGVASRFNPLSTCVSLAYGLPIFLWSGDLRRAESYADQLIEYGGRYSIEPYRATGFGLKGALAIARDELQTGINLLRGALETSITLKLNIFVTDFMGALAEGLRKSGQPEEALLTINRA